MHPESYVPVCSDHLSLSPRLAANASSFIYDVGWVLLRLIWNVGDYVIIDMVGIMRDYQLEGYEWMTSLWENGINGILGEHPPSSF